MKLRVVLLTLLAAAIVGGVVAWWRHTYERVDEWVDLPRTGEAATDPLYALRLSLRAQGFDVRPARRLDPAALGLGPRDTVVYDGDPRRLSAEQVDAVLRWLRGGGRLVIATPPPDVAADALQSTRRLRMGRDPRHLDVPLLDRLGVHARLQPPVCLPLVLERKDPHREFCAGRRFDAPANALARWGDGQGDVYARIAVPGGRGRVDVLAELDFITTDKLREPTHAGLARPLFAGLDRRGTVHLVHATNVPSLWMLLLREGWRVWIPLVLLLAGWLWARMRRFGPLQPAPDDARRSLLEHVAASGEHQWRYRQGDALHAAMREAFLARLRRRDPQAAALDGDARVQRLVERLGLPAAHVRDALTPPDPRDGRALFARIATLVRMRNRL